MVFQLNSIDNQGITVLQRHKREKMKRPRTANCNTLTKGQRHKKFLAMQVYYIM